MDSFERKTQRGEYLSTLNSFIKSSSEVFEHFTKEIGWTKPPDRMNQPCRFTEAHKFAEKVSETSSINEYSEEPLLPSFLPSASQKWSVVIDSEKQRNLLFPCRKNATPDLRQPPSSAGELAGNFTREERLVLYEHTLRSTAPVVAPPELLPVGMVDSTESQPKELSGLELKKAIRDFKRRRQAYRTKVSTKNKSQTEVTREVIHSMMALLGVDEPEFDSFGTSIRLHTPLCNSDGDSDLDTVVKIAGSTSAINQTATDSYQTRDLKYTKYQEPRPMRSDQESDDKNRSPRGSVKDQTYNNMCHDSCRIVMKAEKKYRRKGEKYDTKFESRGISDKCHSRCKVRESSQRREKRTGKCNDESEYNGYEDREMRKDKKGKYENERRCHSLESFAAEPRESKKSESRKRKGNDKT